ncbi:hypothetical protein ACFWUP_03270 [Nocardia sp. NPDC058658]|uniref:hypothetical protein n=1 Tax=Nocardia sp. NPDC058658 TaxID=3346580 RepID=UPI0036557AAE
MRIPSRIFPAVLLAAITCLILAIFGRKTTSSHAPGETYFPDGLYLATILSLTVSIGATLVVDHFFGKSDRAPRWYGFGFAAGVVVFILGFPWANLDRGGGQAFSVLEWWRAPMIAAVAYLVAAVLDAYSRDQREREAALAQREREAHARAHRQRELGDRLQQCTADALNAFEELPTHLIAARDTLDHAEQLFRENAFAPFWSAIENGTAHLGRFSATVVRLRLCASAYAVAAAEYEGAAPPFPVATTSLEYLTAHEVLVARLHELVRPAQRDFHFASIYEQRKTNTILVAGFGTLASALDTMGSRLANEIGELRTGVATMSTSLSSELSGMHSSIATYQRERGHVDGELLHRHDRVVSMLDNIQRGHRPLL